MSEEIHDPESFEGARSSGGIRQLLIFVALAGGCVALALFTPLGRYFHTDTISRLVAGLGYWGPVAILGVGIVSPVSASNCGNCSPPT